MGLLRELARFPAHKVAIAPRRRRFMYRDGTPGYRDLTQLRFVEIHELPVQLQPRDNRLVVLDPTSTGHDASAALIGSNAASAANWDVTRATFAQAEATITDRARANMDSGRRDRLLPFAADLRQPPEAHPSSIGASPAFIKPTKNRALDIKAPAQRPPKPTTPAERHA